jgi:hypothetical protein
MAADDLTATLAALAYAQILIIMLCLLKRANRRTIPPLLILNVAALLHLEGVLPTALDSILMPVFMMPVLWMIWREGLWKFPCLADLMPEREAVRVHDPVVPLSD